MISLRSLSKNYMISCQLKEKKKKKITYWLISFFFLLLVGGSGLIGFWNRRHFLDFQNVIIAREKERENTIEKYLDLEKKKLNDSKNNINI